MFGTGICIVKFQFLSTSFFKSSCKRETDKRIYKFYQRLKTKELQSSPVPNLINFLKISKFSAVLFQEEVFYKEI